ncbi:MAG: hypothetical protein WBR18_11265 [Anaerolineales bacterium]
MDLKRQRICFPLFLLPILAFGCAPAADITAGTTRRPPPTAIAAAGAATETSVPTALTGTQDPTEAWISTLATLDSQLTSEPCSPDRVLGYSNAVLPLSDEHMADAATARRLDGHDDQAMIDEMYDRAVIRRDQLESIVPPACASTAHLKFSSAFRLLVGVWNHIEEREYELAQRKLESSFDELAKGATLLTAIQSSLSIEP